MISKVTLESNVLLEDGKRKHIGCKFFSWQAREVGKDNLL
jgi:hypothetical protein